MRRSSLVDNRRRPMPNALDMADVMASSARGVDGEDAPFTARRRLFAEVGKSSPLPSIPDSRRLLRPDGGVGAMIASGSLQAIAETAVTRSLVSWRKLGQGPSELEDFVASGLSGRRARVTGH